MKTEKKINLKKKRKGMGNGKKKIFLKKFIQEE
jgi:hypothetical protein